MNMLQIAACTRKYPTWLFFQNFQHIDPLMKFHTCLWLLSNSQLILHVFAIRDCNSLLLTIQFQDTLTPEVQQYLWSGSVYRTPSHVCITVSHVTLAQGSRLKGVRARHTIHVSCAWLCLTSLRLSTLHSSQSLPSSTSSSWSSTSSSVWVGSEIKSSVRFREWGVWPFGQQRPSHKSWAQLLRRLPRVRDHWNFHPGVLHRHQALELAWLGDQWLHHRQSALFTTVHSGARRTSGPYTSLSLSGRKFVVKSVVVCRSCKHRETC